MLVLKNNKIIAKEKNNSAAIDAVIAATEKTSIWAGVLSLDEKEIVANDLGNDAANLLENGYELLTNGDFRYAPFKWQELNAMSLEEVNSLLSDAGLSEYSVEE